jgi:hypothetical protein
MEQPTERQQPIESVAFATWVAAGGVADGKPDRSDPDVWRSRYFPFVLARKACSYSSREAALHLEAA